MIIPSIVTATVHKDNIDTRVGLVFNKIDSVGIFVSRIKDSSPFQKTALCEGDRVLAINGKTNIPEVEDVVDIIREAPAEVTILGTSESIPRGFEFAFATSPVNPYDPGIRFGLTRNVLVRVNSIEEDGPFSDSSLNVGDLCLMVNGIPVCDPRRAANLIKGTKSSFTYVLFMNAATFRQDAIEWLKRERKGKLWNVEWPSIDECIMNVRESSTTVKKAPTFYKVKLRFLKDFTCDDGDPFAHLADIKDHPQRIAKYYVPFMKDVQEMNRSFCDSKMQSLETAVQRANDSIYDADSSDDFMVKLREVIDMQRKGYLGDDEFCAAKAKLLGITPQNESSTVAVAVALPATL